MKIRRTLSILTLLVCQTSLVHVAKADYTNDLLASWSFSSGTTNDLVSENGVFTFEQTGFGADQTMTNNVDGTISLGGGQQLLVTGLNSTTYPDLLTNVTIWARFRYDQAPAIDLYGFGLMNTLPPDATDQAALVHYHINATSVESLYGRSTDNVTETNAFGPGSGQPPTPAAGEFIEIAVTFKTADATHYVYTLSSNGVVLVNNTSVATLANQLLPFSGFAIGRLRSLGGVPMSFDEVRVYRKALTPAQIAAIAKPALSAPPSEPNLVAKWSFSHGNVRDELSDDDRFTFVESGNGGAQTTLFKPDGTITLGSGRELYCPDLNSAAYPQMQTNVTIWVRMAYASNNPAAFVYPFGLTTLSGPVASKSLMSLAAIHQTNTSTHVVGEASVGIVTDGTTAASIGAGSGWLPTPGVGTLANFAITFTQTDATHVSYRVNLNGTELARTRTGPESILTNFVCFAIGRLLSGAGTALTFDEVRVYDKELTAIEISHIGLTNITAFPDFTATAWTTSTTVSPLVNDFDPDTLPLTVVSVSPTNATASILNGTNVLVSPTLGTTGTVYVAYTMTNGNGGTASSLISITLTNPPASVANPDFATTPWNVPVTISPLVNDTDPDVSLLTVLSVSPTNGTASIINGTNVLVTPTQGSTNPVTVGYVSTNGSGSSASSVITVNVTIPPIPTITGIVRVGSDLFVNGTNGAPNGVYQVLTSTNLALPLSSWSPILTNMFDGAGSFSVTNVLDPSKQRSFFLIHQ